MNRKRKMSSTMGDEHVDAMDTISNLPECILLEILSLLDLKESCRASCVSRKFHRLCSTNPVLVFDAVQFQTYSFVNFIDDTMRRYSDHNISIKRFKLNIKIDEYFALYLDGIRMINTWIGIAVGNHVETLDLCILPIDAPEGEFPYPCKVYKLPEVVLSANSLKVLKLHNLEFANFSEDKNINLRSLEYMLLSCVEFRDDCLLRHMISSCPLKVLCIEYCCGYISQVNISESSKIRKAFIRQEDFSVLSRVDLINLEASSLEDFGYYGHSGDITAQWPLRIAVPGKLLNLRKLSIGSAPITDAMVENLVPRLPLLEYLMLYECYCLKCVKISNFFLKRFELKFCFKLEKVDIDAPNLDLFHFSGKLYDKYPILSWSKCPAHCTASIIQPCPQHINYFTRLRKFFVQSNMFSVLRLYLAVRNKVEFNAEDVMKMSTEPPYKLDQLVLMIHNANPVESAISAMIEGLLWSCHPNTLSLEMDMEQATYLYANPNVRKIIMQKLSACALSWTHPLKGVEVKSIDWERLCEMASFRSFMAGKICLVLAFFCKTN